MEQFVTDPGFPVYPDASTISSFIRERPGERPPLMLSIGDASFTRPVVSERLLGYLRRTPPELHGYQASMGGLPGARRAISEYVVRTNNLVASDQGKTFEIALTAGGTRGVMGDFGRYLRSHDRMDAQDRTPVALCASPGWDYAGPLTESGYEMAYWPLRPENNWTPEIDEAKRVADRIAARPDRKLRLIVVNAQHNPTGQGWTRDQLESLFELAVTHDAALLLDDPYHQVHTTRVTPESALAVLLEFLERSSSSTKPLPWCAVRSFGKQLGVNGWGVGALVTHPTVLEELLERAFTRRFPANAHHEWAIAQYLNDPEHIGEGQAHKESLTRKRGCLRSLLRSLGWPEDRVSSGEFTPYMLVAVPPSWSNGADGAEQFRQFLLGKTGILVAHASIENPSTELTGEGSQWVRFYLGIADDVFQDMISRITSAGLSYHSHAD